MFPMATACGNTMLIKPSEKDPGACMMLVELARQAGFPDGVVNVIHGAHDGLLDFNKIEIFQVVLLSFYTFKAVNLICDHPSIKAISFVGSDKAVIINNIF